MQQRPAVGRRFGGLCTMLALIGIAAWVGPAAAQKTDLIYLKNGDRITGEVKNLERGRMMVKTDNIGTLYVEWEAVDRIVSDKTMEVELTNGRRVLGELTATGDEHTLAVDRGNVSERFYVDDIIAIDQVLVDRSFWQRLDGKVGLGLNYTKGSDVGQLFFNGNTKYREIRSEYLLNWNTILTSNGTGEDSRLGNLGGTRKCRSQR